MTLPAQEQTLTDSGPPVVAESLNRTILRLAMPAVVENLLQTVVFFADTLMIGWLRDPTALAAVGLAGTLFYLLTTLFNALAVSGAALVARAWGARRPHQAQEFAGQALMLSGLASLITMGIFIPLAPTYLRWMGAEPAVVAAGSRYIRIILAASLLSWPMQVANGIMRGAGDTRTPMWNTLAMNTWNIVANGLLIFGLLGLPALGLDGAAWGSMSARSLGGVLAVGSLVGGRTVIRVPWRAMLRWRPSTVRTLVDLAVPTAIEGAVAQSGYLVFTRLVASLGTVALAAHQIALRIESLSYMPSWGLAVAATTLVGQALGARDPDLAERSLRRTLLFSLIFNGLLSLCFLAFARPLVGIFGSTPEVLALAALALSIAAAEMPALGLEMILAGGLRGAGDTRTPMVVTLVGVLFLRILVVYLLAIRMGWGLAGVWWGTAIDWNVRALLMWILFRRGRWRDIRLLEEGTPDPERSV